MVQQPELPFALPTRDSFTVTMEKDGGISLHVTITRETLDVLRRHNTAELQELAAVLFSLQTKVSPPASPAGN